MSHTIDWTTMDYGSSEVVVGKLGNTPVYRGYFTGTLAAGWPTGGMTEIGSGITRIISYSGYVNRSSGNKFTIPWVNCNSNTGLVTEIFRLYLMSSGQMRLQLFSADDTSAQTYELWVEYTKS